MFAEESYNDLDVNIGIVMPILTDCDVDEDFTEGMEKVGEELPILPLRNMVLFPSGISSTRTISATTPVAYKSSIFGSSVFISFWQTTPIRLFLWAASLIRRIDLGRPIITGIATPGNSTIFRSGRFVCDGSCGRYCPRARNARRNNNRDPAR